MDKMKLDSEGVLMTSESLGKFSYQIKNKGEIEMICGGNASRVKIFKPMSKSEIIDKLGCLKNGEIDLDLLEKALAKEKDDVKKYIKARLGV